MACTDPAVKALNKLGYNMVKLPRVGIDPLDVLGVEDRNVEKLGRIDEVWTSSNPVPTPSAPKPVSEINGMKSSDLDLGIGLNFLAGALSGLGASIGLPKLKLGFKNAKRVQYKYVNVTSSSVSPFALGGFLKSGSLDLSNPAVSAYFGNDDTDEYIIVDTLRSDSISVTAKNENGGTVDADVTALTGALGGSVQLKAAGTSSQELVFQGPVPVTFAFKIFRADFDNGKWLLKGAKADDELSFATEDEEPTEPFLLGRSGLMIRLNR